MNAFGNPAWNLPPGLTPKGLDEATGGSGLDICEVCNGEGVIFESDCCGAAFAEPGFPDNDLCSKCHEHSEPSKCERCDGTGKINVTAEAQERKEAAEEDKADAERDERR